MKAIIVLGCQIIKNPFTQKYEPSDLLKTRLDKGYEEFCKNYDDRTIIIVCGGNPHGEEITEAEVMKSYLIDKGITSYRIFKEDKSINTFQNCINVYDLLGNLNKKRITFQDLHPNKYDYEGPKGFIPKVKEVTIITSDFHMPRSKNIFLENNIYNLSLKFIESLSPNNIDPSYLQRENFYCPL